MHRAVRAIVVTVVLTAVVALPGVQATAAPGRASLGGSKPSWARPETKGSDSSPSAKIQFRVYLHGRDDAGAEAAALAISTPGSARFRQFMTPAQVLAAFGPTSSTVDTVSAWLSGNGMHIDEVADNRLYIEVTSTVAQAQSAFDVRIGRYNVKGRSLRAPDRDLSLPSNVSGLVDAVIGLDQSQALFAPAVVEPSQDGAGSPGTVPPTDGFRNAPPCSSYWAEKTDTTDPAYKGYPANLPYAPCGYIPSQLRAVYGMGGALTQGIKGKGVTVAIIDAFASPTLLADAQQYAKTNDPAYPLTKQQFHQSLFPTNHDLEPPDQCDAAGWYGEQTLDVEAVHAMAPAADIIYVGGADCQDVSLDKALNRVVSQHLAQIVSNSYGDAGEDIPADEVAAFHAIARNAVLEGIGVYFSSGDDGDEKAALGQPSADFSATDSLVTAVGGTSVGIGADGSRVLETGWETSKSTLVKGKYQPPNGAFLYGSGGGTSVLFAQPSYQQGVVPDALATQNQHPGQKGRVVPDISAVGDPNTGMLVGQTQTFPDGVYYDQYRIGGTSLSCPLLAGIMALADSAYGTHGFINPSLYALAGTSALNDVQHVTAAVDRVDYVNGVDASNGTVTSVRTFDFQGLTIKTTPGYDNVTGLGTPNGLTFLNQI